VSGIAASLGCAGLLLHLGPAAAQTPQALRIVVIEGEDAVNIIQQKTAVAPVVEVRDRNDLPVAGVPVTFAISGGKSAAFAGGVQQITIVTNAAGRAVVPGLTPLASGPVQIGVTATYQGQTVAATIAQTNALTAAQAGGGAAGAGGAGGGGTGAGGTGGGGVSKGTLAAVAGGAGAAVGALIATQEESEAAPPPITVTGAFSGQYVVTFTHRPTGNVCQSTRTMVGTMTMTLQPPPAAPAGTASFTGTQATVATNCQFGTIDSVSFGGSGLELTGGSQNLQFTQVLSSTGTAGDGQPVQRVFTRAFAGSRNGNEVSGTLTFTERQESAVEIGEGSVGIPVTLR
jgi:hypothetical protein